MLLYNIALLHVCKVKETGGHSEKFLGSIFYIGKIYENCKNNLQISRCDYWTFDQVHSFTLGVSLWQNLSWVRRLRRIN